MTGREVPEQSILLAIPVSDPSLALHRLVVERYLEFGESGGLAVWWRPIASTTLADPIYKSLRSPELERRDHNQGRKYLHYCEKAGGEDNYVRGEYIKLARAYGIRDDLRPAIVLEPKPACGHVATLILSPAALETAERRRALACFLYTELGEKRIRQFASDEAFDADSIAQLQRHTETIGRFAANAIAKDRPIPKTFWESYLAQTGLTGRPDPEIHTTARAWREKDTLVLETATNGTTDGRVVFEPQEGRLTLQQQLMWHLLLLWPRGLDFEAIAKEFYADEFSAARQAKDPDKGRDHLMVVAKRVRALVHAVRTDKLDPAGINPEILPTVLKTRTRNQTVRLRFAALDRRQLGHLSRPRY